MSEADQFCRNFLYKLPDNRRDGRAILAALRRGLGKPPGRDPEVLKWVYPEFEVRCRPEERIDREDPFLIVASLYAHHPQYRGAQGNFGWTLAKVRAGKKGSDSLDKRFEALLQCDRRELPTLLRHAVSLARSAEEPIDFAKLCDDIAQWEDNQKVQRAWARAYWHPRATSDESTVTAGTESSHESN